MVAERVRRDKEDTNAILLLVDTQNTLAKDRSTPPSKVWNNLCKVDLLAPPSPKEDSIADSQTKL